MQPLKSVNDRRCLTKCHAAGNKLYLHPILLTPFQDRNIPTCAIYPVYNPNDEGIKIPNMIWADACRLEDNDKYQLPNESESMLLGFYFNPNDFLTSIYDLHSFDQTIYWTYEFDYLPFDTIKRVHNCAWRVYGNRAGEVTNTVIEYYYDIAKNYWLKDYAKMIETDYSFDLVSENKTNNPQSAIYQVLLDKYFTIDFFTKAIRNYIQDYSNQWDLIENHYQNIKKYVYHLLVEELNVSR